MTEDQLEQEALGWSAEEGYIRCLHQAGELSAKAWEVIA